MITYKNLLYHVLHHGAQSADRTGTGTIKVFGYQFRHTMKDGFPLLTSKKMSWKSLVAEFVWMMRGLTDFASLKELGCNYWDQWVKPDGTFGPIYGKQWRDFGGHHGIDGNEDPQYFPGIDQIKQVFATLQKDPDGRRHIVMAWNPEDLSEQALPPCHIGFQFGHTNGFLNLHMWQRSADAFLGVPYNIAFYGLMLELFAHCLGWGVGDLVISFTDLHIYSNHFAQVQEYLNRPEHKLPEVYIDGGIKVPWEVRPSDMDLVHYKSEPAIKAPVAV